MTPGLPFIHENFLLENKYAEDLYQTYARKMPIIDYHNHLTPGDIANDTIFANITKVWIAGDHYKWRAMRTLGVDEHFITGNGSDKEKFDKWAESVPYTLRNPLYHWTHLELARYFDIHELLDKNSADAIYHEASGKLNTEAYSCRKLLTKMNVEVLCTTEDPIDRLEHHQTIAESGFKTRVSTAFRPDKSILIQDPAYNDYLDRLEEAANISISSYDTLCDALRSRISYFNRHGCKLSDHGLNHMYYEPASSPVIASIFLKKRNRQVLTGMEAAQFQSALLLFLAETYHEMGWVQQFHLGALRNNNSRMNSELGPDTGWDSIGDYPQAEKLSKFLDALDSRDKLAKTILYNSNPGDNPVLATMVGNFNDGSIRGKVQFGSGWWFLDQKDGMVRQMNDLSNMGLISCFIGMLTDSRSFLSFPRHEYFRRVLCNLFGQEIERGELPAEMEWIGKIIQDISYYNAKAYFNF